MIPQRDRAAEYDKGFRDDLCHWIETDRRLKAAVGYVPYFGYPFFPAFGRDKHGLDNVVLPNREPLKLCCKNGRCDSGLESGVPTQVVPLDRSSGFSFTPIDATAATGGG